MSKVRVYGPAQRYTFRELRIVDPKKKYIFAPLVAFYIEHLRPIGWVLIFKEKGYTGPEVGQILMKTAEITTAKMQEYFGKDINHAIEEAGPNAVAVRAEWNGGTAEVRVEPRDEFSEDWLASLPLAKERWKRYTEILTERDVRAIFELSKMGYRYFLDPSRPDHLVAIIKHSYGLDTYDKAKYIDMIKAAVDEYARGYEESKEKYKETTRYFNGVATASVELAYYVLGAF